MNVPLENHDEIRNLIGANSLWEPKWREMVEAILISLRCIRVNTEIGSQTPQEIANLKHLDLIDAELERLAKEGLGLKFEERLGSLEGPVEFEGV